MYVQLLPCPTIEHYSNKPACVCDECIRILRIMLTRCWGSPRCTKDDPANITRCPVEPATRDSMPADSGTTSSGSSTCSAGFSIGAPEGDEYHGVTAEFNRVEDDGGTSPPRSLPRQSVASNLSWDDDLAAVPQEIHPLGESEACVGRPIADGDGGNRGDGDDGYLSSDSLPSNSQLFPKTFNMYMDREQDITSWDPHSYQEMEPRSSEPLSLCQFPHLERADSPRVSMGQQNHWTMARVSPFSQATTGWPPSTQFRSSPSLRIEGPWASVDSINAQGQSRSWLPFPGRDSRAGNLQYDCATQDVDWHADQENLQNRLCGTYVGDGEYPDHGGEHAGWLGQTPVHEQQDVIGKLHDLIGSTEERYAAMLAHLQKRVQDAECASQDHEDQLHQQRAAASRLQKQLTVEIVEKDNLRRALDQAMDQLGLSGREITEERARKKELENDLQQCRDEYAVLKEELAQQAKKLQAVQAEEQQGNVQLAMAKREAAGQQARAEQSGVHVAHLRDALHECHRSREAADCRVAELNSHVQRLMTESTSLKQQLGQARDKCQSLCSDLTASQRRVWDLEERCRMYEQNQARAAKACSPIQRRPVLTGQPLSARSGSSQEWEMLATRSIQGEQHLEGVPYSQLQKSTMHRQDAQLDHYVRTSTSSDLQAAGHQLTASWSRTQEPPLPSQSYPGTCETGRALLLTASPPHQRHAPEHLQQPRSSLQEHEPTQGMEKSFNCCEERGPVDWTRGHLRAYRGEGDGSLASSFESSAGRFHSNGGGTLDPAPQKHGEIVRVPAWIETTKQHGSSENDPRQALGMVPHQPHTPRDITNGGREAKPYATEESLEVFMKGGAKALEDQLLQLNQEKAMLEHEVSKSLASSLSRTLVERSRRHQAEARLQLISHDITQVRQKLRRLAGEIGPS